MYYRTVLRRNTLVDLEKNTGIRLIFQKVQAHYSRLSVPGSGPSR